MSAHLGGRKGNGGRLGHRRDPGPSWVGPVPLAFYPWCLGCAGYVVLMLRGRRLSSRALTAGPSPPWRSACQGCHIVVPRHQRVVITSGGRPSGPWLSCHDHPLAGPTTWQWLAFAGCWPAKAPVPLELGAKAPAHPGAGRKGTRAGALVICPVSPWGLRFRGPTRAVLRNRTMTDDDGRQRTRTDDDGRP